MYCRRICNDVFHISNHNIPNLFLEIIKIKIAQSMQLNKLTIIGNLKTDSSSYGNRHSKIIKTRIIHIKKWYPKLYLYNLSKIYKVYFCLKWCSPIISQPYNTSKHRKICCFYCLIKRTNNKVLHSTIFLLIYKYCNFTIFYP